MTTTTTDTRPPPVTTAPTAARTVDAVKIYGSGDTAVRALDRITLDLPEARFTAIMGPSGSGKSTLLHCVAGLDPLTSGRVLVGDTDLSRLSDRQLTRLRREHLGFVFQAFNLVPVLNAAENVALPLVIGGTPPSQIEAQVSELVEKVGLSGRTHLLPSQLSGGEQQRVAVARALIARPSVIFADEPTGNLDQTAGRQVMGLLRDLHAEGQTIVVVTHEPHVASYAGRIFFMRDGEIVDEVAVSKPGDPAGVISQLIEHDAGEVVS